MKNLIIAILLLLSTGIYGQRQSTIRVDGITYVPKTQAQRLAMTNLKQGLVVFQSDGGIVGLWLYNGTVWIPPALSTLSDANLRDRTTHTGLQPISSITNLQTTLDGKISNLNGYFTGTLGVGITAPISTFQSGGTATIGIGATASTVGNMQLITNNAIPFSNRITYGTDGTGYKFSIGKNQAGVITDQLVVQTDGKVGVGVVSPTVEFDVLGQIKASAGINGLSYKLPNSSFPNLFEPSPENSYLNVRIVQNLSPIYTDGLYVGYNNGSAGFTKIFDGGSVNALTVGAGSLFTNGITRFMFGDQTDDGNFAQFSGNLKTKGALKTNSDISMDVNNKYLYMTESIGTPRKVMGIGTDNTFYVGDVDNNIVGNNNVYQSKGFHIFRNNSFETMRVTPAGYVGIGTPSPTNFLHVKMALNQNLVFSPNANGFEAGTASIVSVNDLNTGYRPMGFYASKYSVLGGNLIVNNTTDNGYKLQVTGTASISGLLSIGESLAMDYNQFQYWKESGGASIRLIGFSGVSTMIGDIDNATVGGFTRYFSKTSHVFSNNGFETMRVTPAGYLGIGTPTPVNYLHVKMGTNQNVVFSPNLNALEAGTPSILALNDANTGYTPLGFYATKYSVLGGNFVINNTVDNGYKLQVTGTASISGVLSVGQSLAMDYNQFMYWKDVGGNSKRLFGLTGANTLIGDIDNTLGGSSTRFFAQDSHVFSNNGVERMRINSAGNIGIGTTAPTAKIQVVGIQAFTDNAAAIAGGLTAGAFYRTATGVLMIVF